MKYIGVKIVDAVLMDAATALIAGYKIGRADKDGKGYEVTYPDGYKSWCPKAVFEAANFPLSKDNKITLADVELMRGPLTDTLIGDKSTLVMAKRSLTGFETFATSSCVDPKNYSREIGVECGTKEINNEFWAHLGFVLQWAKNGLSR